MLNKINASDLKKLNFGVFTIEAKIELETRSRPVTNLNIVYEQKYVPNTKTKLHLPAGLIRIRIQIGIDNFKKGTAASTEFRTHWTLH
jgi:hypothetical protein